MAKKSVVYELAISSGALLNVFTLTPKITREQGDQKVIQFFLNADMLRLEPTALSDAEAERLAEEIARRVIAKLVVLPKLQQPVHFGYSGDSTKAL